MLDDSQLSREYSSESALWKADEIHLRLAYTATIQLLADRLCLGYCVYTVVGSEMIMIIQVHIAMG